MRDFDKIVAEAKKPKLKKLRKAFLQATPVAPVLLIVITNFVAAWFYNARLLIFICILNFQTHPGTILSEKCIGRKKRHNLDYDAVVVQYV